MSEKMFTVVPRVKGYPKGNIKLIEGLINRPEFVNRVMAATELFVERFIMPEILYGKTFTDQEKEDGMNKIVAKLSAPGGTK